MVGQEILVLFIMVRIRALQPKIQPPLAGGLIFGSVAPGRHHGNICCLVRKQVDLRSNARANRYGFPAGRKPEGIRTPDFYYCLSRGRSAFQRAKKYFFLCILVYN